jgi:hypothetical protein
MFRPRRGLFDLPCILALIQQEDVCFVHLGFGRSCHSVGDFPPTIALRAHVLEASPTIRPFTSLLPRSLLQASYANSSVGVWLTLLLALASPAAASVVAAADALPSPIDFIDHSYTQPPAVLIVATTAQLRDALERSDANGRVTLYLPEGNVYPLNGTQLHIPSIHASLKSDGAGATLDAQGMSLHFDVAPGGQLHLHRVHTRGGMMGMNMNMSHHGSNGMMGTTHAT